jgi:methionine synthase II (cobalamin-independent)
MPTDIIKIPDWVRNNAKWWAEGSIGDKDFASGIQYMIKQGIIIIPLSENGGANQNIKIPDWVRNNAKWWAEGSIGDKDFASGIQYMIKIGIISV